MVNVIMPANKEDLSLPFDKKLELTKKIMEEAKKYGAPIVGLSGGLHSSLLFALARENGINEAFHVDINLGFPEQREYVERLKKNGAVVYEYISPYSEEELIREFGLPCFKGLQSVLSRKEWGKYGLTDACRKVRDKQYRKAWIEHKGRVYLLGMLAREKLARYYQWTQTGYLYEKDGKYFAKPIAHFTLDEAWKLAHEKIADYPFNLYDDGKGGYMKGDLGCWLCSVRMFREDGGNLGYLYRNKRDLWNRLMFGYGLSDTLVRIWRDKKDERLGKFLEKYDLLPIGMDFDGVVCEKLVFYSRKTKEDRERYYENIRNAKPRMLFEALNKNVYLITGRRMEDKEATEEWLRKYGAERLSSRIYYLPYQRSFDNMVKFKAEMIKKLGLVKFYEDDERIAKRLKKLVPECEIIQVE
jgi:3'-phosphoadenosine 5'-phosphosulfate sulfotransferase (PAPS reductase)/FAD synthetase